MSKYLVLSISVFIIVVVLAAWLPNLHLISRTMASSSMTVWQKTNLLTGLLGSLQTNFTPLSRMVTLAAAAPLMSISSIIVATNAVLLNRAESDLINI